MTASRAEAGPLAPLRALRRRGRHDEVVAGCLALLQETLADLEAEHLLARAMTARGQADTASLILEGLARRAPGDAALRASLSRALLTLGDVGGGITQADASLELAPGWSRALRARALARRAATDLDGSLADLVAAADADPAHLGGQNLLAQGLLMAGDERSRAQVAHLAVADPDFRASMMLIAYRFTQEGMTAAAGRTLTAALEQVPGDAELTHLLDTTFGRPVERAPDAFVREHFDRFAEHFDEVLERLDYHAPELVAELVLRDSPGQDGLDVLDAGCGTGLCGPLLRDAARSLIGVDLSGGMVGQARARGVYDELHEAELVAWLEAHPAAYDLVVAADVLNYFGELGPPTAAAARSLRAGGRLAFTVERREAGRGDGPGFHSRWAHSEQHVDEACRAAGLEVATLEAAVLRKEAGVPVEGTLVLARRPAGGAG